MVELLHILINLNIKLKRVRLRKEFNNTTEHGTIHILVNNARFSKMFKQIIDLSKNKRRHFPVLHKKQSLPEPGPDFG